MKYDLYPVVSADAIDIEIQSHFNKAVDIRTLFFEGDYMNDSFKLLSFDDNSIEEAKSDAEDYDAPIYQDRLSILNFLRQEFSTYTSILVDVSW